METRPNPPKQTEVSSDRKKLLADELETARSTTIVEQLPMLITANGLWGLVYFFAIGHHRSWPFAMAGSMAVLLMPALLSFKKSKGLPPPVALTWCKTRPFTAYVGLLGVLWGGSILIYLPYMPLNMLCMLMTGCLFLMCWVAGALHPMPSASMAYMVPISLAGLYVGSPPSSDIHLLLITVVVFATGGSAWALMNSWKKFLEFVEVGMERNHFLNASEVAAVSRNQFLENVSHEIKTPLTAVLGYTRLLAAEKSKIPNVHGKTLDHLEISAVALLRSVDVLLDVANLKAGKLELQESFIDIRSIVKNAVTLVQRAADGKNIELQISFGPDVPHLLLGDPDRVDQIIYNLLENAVKFTRSGCVQINVSCDYPEVLLSKEKMLCIAVIDTGIGIDISKHASIFSNFYQVDGSVTRHHGGMGLGLTVSKMLANLMDGDLSFDSDGHTGSTFECWLPIKLKNEGSPKQMSLTLASRDHDEAWHVLIVDDDVYIRHYLQVLLSAAGWIVELCESGISAISRCSEKKYSLILMDIQMPVMTGIEASKIIWSKSLNSDTPILVMTGYLSTDRITELRLAGLLHYLGKPLVPDELLAKARHTVLNSSAIVAAASGSNK